MHGVLELDHLIILLGSGNNWVSLDKYAWNCHVEHMVLMDHDNVNSEFKFQMHKHETKKLC